MVNGDDSEFSIDGMSEMREYLMSGGKRKVKRGSKKSKSKKGSRKLRRSKASKGSKKSSKSKRGSKRTVRRTSKKGSKKTSRRKSKSGSRKRLSRAKKLRLSRSPGQNAYFDFINYINKALGIAGGVSFKLGSHYKKKAESANPGVVGEGIYKFARDMFDSDNKDTKNKLIEKFKIEIANKPRKSKKAKPTNFSETSN